MLRFLPRAPLVRFRTTKLLNKIMYSKALPLLSSRRKRVGKELGNLGKTMETSGSLPVKTWGKVHSGTDPTVHFRVQRGWCG